MVLESMQHANALSILQKFTCSQGVSPTCCAGGEVNQAAMEAGYCRPAKSVVPYSSPLIRQHAATHSAS